MAFAKRKEGSITIHGKGEIGGKGRGLVQLNQMKLKKQGRLKTEILAGEFYKRFMDNDKKLDKESAEKLKKIHSALDGRPMSVRPSEKYENDPLVATSGENISFMLPNSHPEPKTRFEQFKQAIIHAFSQFAGKTPKLEENEDVAVVLAPIPGVFENTDAGRIYYPMSSGVADSFFYYPVAEKKAEEGVARLAFGHGYATVRNDFDVVPMLTIHNPAKPSGISRPQRFFYAINLNKNERLDGTDMETMTLLSTKFVKENVKNFGNAYRVNFDKLISEDRFGYASGLRNIMNEISAQSGNFQIEFTFNVFDGNGVFHIVQYKKLRDLRKEKITIPKDGQRNYISTERVQGHGVKRNITSAIVISPFNYRKEQHNGIVKKISELNSEMKEKNEKYILVCPGRIGSSDKNLGIQVDFKDISQSAVIIEYGYNISGSHMVERTNQEMTGGIFGSHFLYQILGGAREDQKRRELMALGSQGTHFITNLITNGTIYLHVDPGTATFDPWFFTPPEGQENNPVFTKEFSNPVTAYADLFKRKCVIK